MTIILEGGLGNRMRAAVSAYAMMRQTGVSSRVLWLPQWGMHCRFDELFLPVEAEGCEVCDGAEGFELRDADSVEQCFYARPTLRNLHLPLLLQWVRHRGRVLSSSRVLELSRQDFDFATWCRRGNPLMCSYRDFFPWRSADLRHLFQPNEQVQRLIRERCRDFTSHTIGIHIRRTDHQQAISDSPLELFIEAIDRELALPRTEGAGSGTSIFLATDDEATKQALLGRYGQRVITSPNKATRDSAEGIQEALAEMVALSRTDKIYGSANSTFSQIAACLGDIPIEILTRHGLGESNLKVSV